MIYIVQDYLFPEMTPPRTGIAEATGSPVANVGSGTTDDGDSSADVELLRQMLRERCVMVHVHWNHACIWRGYHAQHLNQLWNECRDESLADRDKTILSLKREILSLTTELTNVKRHASAARQSTDRYIPAKLMAVPILTGNSEIFLVFFSTPCVGCLELSRTCHLIENDLFRIGWIQF